ncbi:nuclear pore complex protein NUP214-like isoform X2 [Rhododendron vialii]|uniref:nuclear pore complex protein NUP214-like isoform X2 n=1 Tax=Rhododendron vialii TaxID=182163 RepID=UPI00265DA41E|nr:nuclear pore complex protein NUP214-like isoform X2 [Rhododendron vialii]
MAATEDNRIILGVDDEVEGERTGSDDYCFIGIGEAVPIKPGDDAEFDPQNPPSKPLTVSERFGLIFVSHSTGFCVARTKDIIDSANEIAERGNGSSIKELSVVDVPIGQVYILALSADSSTLAACIDGKIHFFSVTSLLNKDQSPFFSCSLDDSSCVKDMQWTKKLENYYAVLSNHGNLYYGAGQDPLKSVMDDVDAFDWSLKGNLVAVARKNTLSIMSLKLKEKVCISLSFDSWIGDSNLNFAVKVDSIRWVRPDSIILGCFQLTSDGKEENYLVQVITSKDGKFTDTSSKPIVLSFSDVFEAFVDDIVPFGSGPYMSLSYLSTCELAITANRKSTDQHIVLFGWSLDDRKEAAVIDIVRDTLCPKIALQENGDDNIVLGLCVDRISQNEKVEVQLGAEYKELSPFCILLCLSLDGKLFMYQVASVTGPSVPPDKVSLLSDKEDDTPTLVSSEDGKPSTSGGLVSKSVQVGLGFQSQGVDKKELLMKEGNGIPVTNGPLRPVNSERLETLGQQKFLVTKVDQDTVGQQSLLSAPQGPYFGHLSPKTSYLEEPGPAVIDFSKEETKKLPEGGSSPVSFPGKFSSHVSSQSISTTLPRAFDLDKELSENLESKGAPSSPPLNAKHTFPVTSDGGFSFVPPGSIQSNRSDTSRTNSSNAHFPGVPHGNFSHPKQAASSSTVFSSSGKTSYSGGQSASIGPVIAHPRPTIRSSVSSSQQNFAPVNSSKDKFQPNKENYRAASPTRLLNTEPQLSKQFGNVDEMIKELETLLECIEGPGGFRDACTVHYESSVLELEEGIETLFNGCRVRKSIMDERLGEIQLILDNTVQVLARKIYTEGIVKQATDGQYLDLWNRQKLSSELELKQQHISKVNQELTNQLIELERHLNTLELNKFGENDGIQMSQRTFPGRYGPSRNVQSLHSLHNTMTSQLAAAEQLSECLTKQMAVLSIEPPSAKTQNVRRDLFEEIGIPYNSASFSSPDGKVAGDTHSNKRLLTSSCSDAGKGQSRRNQPSGTRGSESETARRRRDSLDRSWASFEPPKTTVKRVLLHEDRAKASADRSALLDKKHVKSHMLEGSAVARAELYTTTSTLFYPSEGEGIQGRPAKQASVFSSHSAPISSIIARQNNVRGSFNPTANLSSNGVTLIEKPALVVNNSERSQVELHQTPSVSKRFHGQTLSLQKKPSEMSDPNEDTYLVRSTFENANHHPSITKSSFMKSGKGLESPFHYSSVFDPAPNLNAEVFQSDTAASKSHSGSLTSSSPMLSTSSSRSSAPVLSSLLLPSSLPYPTEKTSISIGRSSTSSKTGTNGSQTALLSQSSSSSSSFLSSVSSYQVPEKAVPSAIPIASMNFETESPKREQQHPIPKLTSTTGESSTVQSSFPENEPGFTLKLESSLPVRPGGEPSANLQSVSKPSFDGMANHTMNAALNSKRGPSFATDVSAALLSMSGSASGGKSESANVAVTQEDEMDEEAPETSQTNELTLGSLGSFGIGSSPNPTPGKPNPFGGAFGSVVSTPASSPFSMTVPTGELFRPASFSFQSPQPFQPSQLTNFGALSGGLSMGTTPQISAAGSGFGQPAQPGSGQQALGSVLGAFGQSRQLGGVGPGTSPSSANGFSGGLISSPSTGGFASSTGGGFAGVASPGGGFAAPASAGGGFAGAASGSGFPSSGGGFGAFNSQQGSGGFSGFGSSAGGTGRPPSPLFTQMRK